MEIMDGEVINPIFLFTVIGGFILIMSVIILGMWMELRFRKKHHDWKDKQYKYRNIAGGVLFIIAGALSLLANFIIKDFADFIGAEFNWQGLIVAGIITVFGVLAITGLKRKRDIITLGIIGLGICALRLFNLYSYVGLGYIQMVLIAVGALLFFITKQKVIKGNSTNE